MNQDINSNFSLIDDLFINILNESPSGFYEKLLLDIDIDDELFNCIHSWIKYHVEKSSFIDNYISDFLYNNFFLKKIIQITDFCQKNSFNEEEFCQGVIYNAYNYSIIRIQINKLLNKTKKLSTSTSNYFIIRDAIKFNSLFITKRYIKESNLDSIISLINKQLKVNDSIIYSIKFLLKNKIKINKLDKILEILSKKEKERLLIQSL